MGREHLTLHVVSAGPLDACLNAFLLDREVFRCTPKTLEHYRRIQTQSPKVEHIIDSFKLVWCEITKLSRLWAAGLRSAHGLAPENRTDY